MNKIYLISLDTLKKDYTFDNNIEDKYILPNIDKCQSFIIKPLLGDNKYDEIIEQINNDSVTDENSKLIKVYIAPVIAYFVLSEVVYNTAYKVKNAGVEGTEDFNGLVKISNKYLRDSERYQVLLEDYLYNNALKCKLKDTFKCNLYLD